MSGAAGVLAFAKMEGCRNDYVVLDARRALPASGAALAPFLCDRRAGVGADGLLLVAPDEQADLRMRMFNVDGSEAEMCGNGLRCAVRYAVEHRHVAAPGPISVRTGAGTLSARVVAETRDAWTVSVDMGVPLLERPALPMAGAPGRVVDEPFAIDGTDVALTAVSMGNPHAILFVDDVEAADVAGLGARIERDARFPERTNVEFVEVLDRGRVRQRTWERGCGETLACGTGASAVAVAGVLTDRTDRAVEVALRGGTLSIAWPDDAASVVMEGPARRVFEGEIVVPGDLG